MTIIDDPLSTIAQSVTAGDMADSPHSAIFYFQVAQYYAGQTALPPQPPVYWSHRRDGVLSSTVFFESMWASAIYKAKTEQAALGFEVDDSEDGKIRTRRAQQLLLKADHGDGWVPFILRVLDDFMLTDNGAFIEIIRQSSARGSRIIGLKHLDSFKTTRTADPEYPVIYWDLKGYEHVMRDYQVLMFADEPSARSAMRGVGRCAASRAYNTIYKLAGMETYISEKLTGDGATALDFISGINDKSLEVALTTADGEMKRRGRVNYRGKIIIPVMTRDTINHVEIALKGTPDGFDSKQERDNAYLIYANAIGVPPQTIQPLSGQGLGTGTQTKIHAEDASKYGLAAFREDFKHKLNEYVLSETTTFSWSNDHAIRERKDKADLLAAQATALSTLVGAGIITPPQAMQIAVDLNMVPREFLVNDETAGGNLADDEKPIGANVTESAQTALARLMPAQVAAAPVDTTVKASDDVATLLDDEMAAAIRLVEQILGAPHANSTE